MTTTPAIFKKGTNPKTYRTTKRKDRKDSRWIPADKKEFRVWDGEGVSYMTPEICTCVVPFQKCFVRQNYVLFGYAQLNKGHEYISTTTPGTYLGTEQLLDFMMTHNDPKVFNVWFGSTYDVDQILRDLTVEELDTLRSSDDNAVWWNDYHIMHIPGKRLEITKDHKRIRLDDVVSFFRKSLVNVCKEYLLADKYDGWELIEKIEADKADRGNFTYAEIDNRITEYWKIEGDLMCHLMNQFRKALIAGNIHLKSWLGPGAIANYLIDNNTVQTVNGPLKLSTHIRDSWDTMPQFCKDMTAYSYFGGRFETRIMGNIAGPIYHYDICSAYPAALSQMPALVDGKWVSNDKVRFGMRKIIDPWGLYVYKDHDITNESDAQYVARMMKQPLGPFPYRSERNNNYFTLACNGVLFGHELLVAINAGFKIDILYSWEWEYDNPYPQTGKSLWPLLFDFLPEMYSKRLQYKSEGNPAQYGLKLGMNSLYGKLAQLVGWQREPFREPAKHHAWYAGQATAWCRARIMEACFQNPEAIIAIETDGIYSLAPLDLPISKQLGEWEMEIIDQMVYVQSGVYWYKKQGNTEWEPAKARGFGSKAKGMAGEDAVLAAQKLSEMSTTVHRYGAFTGYRGKPQHGCWFDSPISITFDPYGGKRYHKQLDDKAFPDYPICTGCTGETEWHVTIPFVPEAWTSSWPRILPWKKDERFAQQKETEEKLVTSIFYSDYDTANDIEEF